MLAREEMGVEVAVAVLGEDSDSWWAVICPDSPGCSLTSCPRTVHWGGIARAAVLLGPFPVLRTVV